MKFYIVTCSDERLERFKRSSTPLNINFEIVKSFIASDEIVRRRANMCVKQQKSEFRLAAGCLGHMKAMKQILESGEEYGVVIEDDVIFHKQFKAIIDICERYMRENSHVDIVTIGFVNFPFGTIEVCEGIPFVKNVQRGNPWGTQCYMIRKSYAKRFLDIFEKDDDISKCYNDVFSPDWVIFDVALGCNRSSLCYPYAVESPNEQSFGHNAPSNKPNLFAHINIRDFYV
jgi:GR25 family glycosyltransferase involved in LPS biosynthesis